MHQYIHMEIKEHAIYPHQLDKFILLFIHALLGIYKIWASMQ